MKHPLAGLVALLICLPAPAREDATKEELKKFEGTWQLLSAVRDGKETPKETVEKIRVVIKDGKHSVYFGKDEVVTKIPFNIDPTKMPKEVTDKLPDGKEIKGIYKLEGDDMTSCVAEPGKDRPKEFEAKAGTGNTLRVFKRVKE